MSKFRRAISVVRISAFVITTAVMQEGKEFDDFQIGAAQMTNA